MHGRVKIRTTAEQDELKRKERQKKIAKYVFARNAIVAKRSSTGVDGEALQMITAVLTTIPDFGTLWNWRREGFKEVWKTIPDSALQEKCNAELLFLNKCLEHNPKSYGVWYCNGITDFSSIATSPELIMCRQLQLFSNIVYAGTSGDG